MWSISSLFSSVTLSGVPVLVLAACAVAPAPDDAEATARRALSGPTWVEPDADLAQPPPGALAFCVSVHHHGGENGVEVTERWEELAQPPLFAGAPATLRVDRARFPACGLDGEVVATLRLDSGVELEVPLDAGDPAYERRGAFVVPPDTDTLEVWIKSDRGDGCVEYDSDSGANHRFEVFEWAPTVARFGADGSETLETSLIAGTALMVDYDIARLPHCRVIYRGFPSWNITAYASFDGGEPLEQKIVSFGTGAYGVLDGSHTVMQPVFPVPRAAESVALWFENDQYPPVCHDWDSAGGANYAFDVAAASSHGGGSSGQGGAVPTPPIDPAWAEGGPVELVSSQITIADHPAPYTVVATLVGFAVVEDIAYHKRVAVHVDPVGAPLDGPSEAGWYDVAAQYVAPVGDSHELWRFEVPTTLYKGGQGQLPLFRYAVRYEVEGQTYWDNHDGDDYRDRYLGAPVQLQASSYTTEPHPSPYTMTHVLSGTILVDDLAYDKDVAVHYRGGDGAWHDAAATYSAPSYEYGNYEVWSFAIAAEVYKAPPSSFYQFALSYTVDGVTHWDNHGGQDYDGIVAQPQ